MVTTRRRARGRGMTLVELMIAIVIFSVIVASATQFFITQSRAVRHQTDNMYMMQNLRFGADLLDMHVRTAGANVGPDQPRIIYADSNVFAFNADWASNAAADPHAIYYEPKAPDAQVLSLPLSRAITIPGSSPALTYPDTNYFAADSTPSRAETIVLFFAPDTSTPRTDDWVLFRQVNDAAPEAMVRNVLPLPGKPFFRYLAISDSAQPGLHAVLPADLPIEYDDSAGFNKMDSLRAVEISYRVTNGDTLNEKTRDFTVTAALTNFGAPDPAVNCGAAPTFTKAVTAKGVKGKHGTANYVELDWQPADDEYDNEQDVVRYVVWRRLSGAPAWGDPIASIPAGAPAYRWFDVTTVSGTTYDYAVAAQDCTPSLSAVQPVTIKAP